MSDKENDDIQVDEAFGELLANFVRQHPCLYDKRCKDYKDKKFVADTWTSIAIACNMPVDAVQKQWKILRNQFTREHRLEKMYEPSGTGNDTCKRPRKTWYLYQALFFLAPHVAHRSTSSNFVRRSIITQSSPPTQTALQSAVQSSLSTPQSASQSAAQSSPSTPQSALQSAMQSPSGSSSSSLWNIDLCMTNDSNVSSPPPERLESLESSASVASSASSVGQPRSFSSVGQPRSLSIARKDLLHPPPDQSAAQKMKECRKEQEHLSKMISNTTDSINMLVNNISEKRKQSVTPVDNDDSGEEAAMAKALLYALKRVNYKYKIQCYMQCLSVVDKFQNVTEVEMESDENL